MNLEHPPHLLHEPIDSTLFFPFLHVVGNPTVQALVHAGTIQLGAKGIAWRILSQDDARARRGAIEGPWLRPRPSEQRPSCGRRRSKPQDPSPFSDKLSGAQGGAEGRLEHADEAVASQDLVRRRITTIDMVCCVYDSGCMANASTTLQVRLPVKLRDEAAVMLEEMGLDLPTAIRLYLTKVVRTRRIPFELDANPAVKTVETVEAIEVDEALQGRMDRIGTAWKKAGKKR